MASLAPARAYSVEIVFVAIEGNVAAGKSTIIDMARSETDKFIAVAFGATKSAAAAAAAAGAKPPTFTHHCFVPEPVEQWTVVGADRTDLLAEMYRAPHEAGLACQLNIVHTRLKAIYDAIKSSIESKPSYGDCNVTMLVVTERSTVSDKHIFAGGLREAGHLTSAQWKVYCDAYDAAHVRFHESVKRMLLRALPRATTFAMRAASSLYLLIDPHVALQRMRKRGRPAERDVTLAQLQTIDARHERLYGKRTGAMTCYFYGTCVNVSDDDNGLVNNGDGDDSFYYDARVRNSSSEHRIVLVESLSLYNVLKGLMPLKALLGTVRQPARRTAAVPPAVVDTRITIAATE